MKRIDLNELERKALAATPGEWVWGKGNVEGSLGRVNCLYVDDPERNRAVLALDFDSLYLTLASNTEHISANSPPVTLAIISHIRELHQAIADALYRGADDPGGQLRALIESGPVLP